MSKPLTDLSRFSFGLLGFIIWHVVNNIPHTKKHKASVRHEVWAALPPITAQTGQHPTQGHTAVCFSYVWFSGHPLEEGSRGMETEKQSPKQLSSSLSSSPSKRYGKAQCQLQLLPADGTGLGTPLAGSPHKPLQSRAAGKRQHASSAPSRW